MELTEQWSGHALGWDLEQPISITALEHFAACPYRFFLEHRLKIETDDSVDPERTIAADEHGNLAHRVLRRFFEELAIDSPDHELEVEHHQRLGAILKEEALALVQNDIVTPSPLWDELCAQLLESLHAFLVDDEELRRTLGTVPKWFERRFNERIARFQLRGMIDRLDVDEEGRPLPIDYKTGAALRYKTATKDPLGGGRLLQVPLYALIAERLLDAPPAEEGIYWRLEAEIQRPIRIGLTDEVRSALVENLEVWANAISAGLFPLRPQLEGDASRENCRSCPFDRICPTDREQIWDRLREGPPFAALASVETRTRLEAK
jgi:RecB family exonuclease